VLRWSVLDPRRRDFWGNAVIPSWYSDASPVLGLDGAIRPVTEPAQAAEATVGADGFTVPGR
jgi:catechol 2,3-dioxygenase